MSPKKIYYFLFYKLYKVIKATSVPEFWSDWKALALINILEIVICLTTFNYYKLYINKHADLPNAFILVGIYVLIILLPNAYVFYHRNQWKKIISDFDKLPTASNKIGGWIILGLILFTIASFILSLYLIGQIDWQKY